mmetsp:Transcript_82568/g.239036  ORF Transcript_82568/g.239036 Transcript_82568/m.239036 type:complete len:212 (-) Transcript_82568:236-871(-)
MLAVKGTSTPDRFSTKSFRHGGGGEEPRHSAPEEPAGLGLLLNGRLHDRGCGGMSTEFLPTTMPRNEGASRVAGSASNVCEAPVWHNDFAASSQALPLRRASSLRQVSARRARTLSANVGNATTTRRGVESKCGASELNICNKADVGGRLTPPRARPRTSECNTGGMAMMEPSGSTTVAEVPNAVSLTPSLLMASRCGANSGSHPSREICA